jgi:hypothetical protein
MTVDTQRPYPLDPELQAQSRLFEAHGLQLIGLNSAWEIDEWFPERSSIHPRSVQHAIDTAEKQIDLARHEERLAPDVQILRLAAFHHPATGNDKIQNDAFLDALRKGGVKVCLHGHVHEERADLVGHLHPQRRLHLVGAGTFGTTAAERPKSTPRLYNLLEVWRDHSKIRVHTRCMRRSHGEWEGWAVWPSEAAGARQTYYDIELAAPAESGARRVPSAPENGTASSSEGRFRSRR